MDGNSPYPPGLWSPPAWKWTSAVRADLATFRNHRRTLADPSTPKRRRTGLLASGVALAVLLGVAALVLSIIGLTRGPEPPPPPTPPQAAPQELFVDDADKALCEAIGPLMREESDENERVLANWATDSPERLAAIPKFKAAHVDWANRIQNAAQ